MSYFSPFTKQTGAANPLAAFAKDVASALKTSGVSKSATMGMLGLESHDEARQQLHAAGANVSEIIATALDVAGIAKLTPAQEAAAISIAVALGNPSAYMSAATNTEVVGGTGVSVITASTEGWNGSYDYRENIVGSMEGFSDQNLTNYIGYSVAFNAMSARQDSFSEAFFPTFTVTADKGGIDITARIQTVMNEAKRSLTGRPTDFAQKKMLDAYVDHTILAADALLCVPYYQAGVGGNEDKFVDVTKIPTWNVTIEGIQVTTAALKVGVKSDIIGLSAHPGLLSNNTPNNTDELDGNIRVKTLYVAFQTGTANEEIVAFDVQRLLRTGFVKSVEGRDREFALQARDLDLVIKAGTNDKDVMGGTLDVFSGFASAGHLLRLQVSLSGTADTEYGSIQVDATTPVVAKVYNAATGAEVDITAPGTVSNIAALGAMRVLGFDIYARKTNANRRMKGMQANVQILTERYQIPLGSPLSAPEPLTSGSDRDGQSINDLVNLSRARTSNMAVTKLLDTADMLNEYVSAPIKDTMSISGIGRHYLTPYFKRVSNLDFTQRINSIETHQRLADLKAAMVGEVRTHVLAMLQSSHYKIALDQMTGFSGQKPKVLIGTDQTLGAYLMIDGDSRLLGPDLEYQVEVSYDERVKGKIFITFVRPDVTGPSPLNFGVHVWVPEFTSVVQVTRDGAVVREAMVQPRNTHIMTCPVLTELQVDMAKFAEAASEKTDAPVTIA